MPKLFNYIIYLSVIFLLSILLNSCEDVIDINLDEGTPQLAVDALVTTRPITQQISLTMTSPYFENSPSPVVTGATVKLIDQTNGFVRFFLDDDDDGTYEWTPSSEDQLLIGHPYILTIDANGESYTAFSILNPAPLIDSVTYEFREAEPPVGEEGYYATFYATDIPGRTDYYWIRTSVNGELNDDPGDILIAQDAAFEGDGADGLVFIIPIREGITPFGTTYNLGDTIGVNLHAINLETYIFLALAQSQLTNSGLFAEPPANVPTNIQNIDTESDKKAVGFFCVSDVSSKGVTIR